MPRKKKKPARAQKSKPGKSAGYSPENALEFHTALADVKKILKELQESAQKSEEKIQDLEIHINLLTRLLTTLCIEKLGMRIGVLKRLIKQIEKEAIRDSQIIHLENLYKLSPNPEGKNPPNPPPSASKDPWEDIS